MLDVVIPQEIVLATHMTEVEILQEFAILLYQKEKLTLSLASKLARLNRWQFQQLLASRDIPIHYDEVDLESDLATLRKFMR